MQMVQVVGLLMLSGASGQKTSYLSLNDLCKDGPDTWRCESLSAYPALKEAIKDGQKPSFSFQGHEPIVCYPSYGSLPFKTASTIRPTITTPPNRWTPKPSTNKIKHTTTNSPALSHKLKADQMCEFYSQYVYRTEKSPALIGNEETVKINDCNIPRLIVNGANVQPKEFPHMAHIGYGERPNLKWHCGGSLISPKFVLSAAHCSSTTYSRDAKWVRLGDLDISTDSDDAEPVEMEIIRRIVHPQYSRKHYYNDIALFEMEREVKLGSYIRPICLHTTKNIDSDDALATGWGFTSFAGERSNMLQKVNLNIVSYQKCKQSYHEEDIERRLPNGIDDNSMLCAGGKEGDSCQGDSGGPLQILHKNIYCMYSQIGIISFGKGCATNYPGVYTRVSNYLYWIESIVWP